MEKVTAVNQPLFYAKAVHPGAMRLIDSEQFDRGFKAAIQRHDEVRAKSLSAYGEAVGHEVVELQKLVEGLRDAGFARECAVDVVQSAFATMSNCPFGRKAFLQAEAEGWARKTFEAASQLPSLLRALFALCDETAQLIALGLRPGGAIFKAFVSLCGTTLLLVQTYSCQLQRIRFEEQDRALQVQGQVMKTLLLIIFFYRRVLGQAGVNVIVWPLVPYMRILRRKLEGYLRRSDGVERGAVKLADYLPESLLPKEDEGLTEQVDDKPLQKVEDELYMALALAENEWSGSERDHIQLRAQLGRFGCGLKERLSNVVRDLVSQQKARQEAAWNAPGRRPRFGGHYVMSTPTPAAAPSTPVFAYVSPPPPRDVQSRRSGKKKFDIYAAADAGAAAAAAGEDPPDIPSQRKPRFDQ